MNQRKNLETAMRLGAPATEPDQDWQEAGCSRSCRDGHNRRWGACAYGVEPAPTLARFETGLASDGYVSGGYVSMTTEQIAEWLREQGYTVASQAPQGPQEGEGGHGPVAPPVSYAQTISALLAAQGRMLDDWAEAAYPGTYLSERQQELWRGLHYAAQAVRNHPDHPGGHGAGEGAAEGGEGRTELRATVHALIARAATDLEDPYAIDVATDAVIPAIRAQVAEEVKAERDQFADAIAWEIQLHTQSTGPHQDLDMPTCQRCRTYRELRELPAVRAAGERLRQGIADAIRDGLAIVCRIPEEDR